MSTGTTIVWFRKDLRLTDNPALQAAIESQRAVVPLYIWCPDEEQAWPPGGASRWWLHQSLAALASALGKLGSRLIIRCGPTLPALLEVAGESQAEGIVWNRRYEPSVIERDSLVKAELKAHGLAAASFNASLLVEPWALKTKTGTPYQVFTPFWRAILNAGSPAAPSDAPDTLATPPHWPRSDDLADCALEPRLDWAKGMRDQWTPGEAGALAQLAEFADSALAAYPEDRNRPDRSGSSRLSAHLHFGEIGPRQIWARIQQQGEMDNRPGAAAGTETYLREIGWREFAHHLLFHFPQTTEQPLRRDFAAFPWIDDATGLRAWQRGRTGFPIVDAGMRELWETGWMHNRVRMIAASFLIKDLLVPWQRGAAWFWDTLVDADLANNTLGWQWTAGCGADAAPYFRVFNPISQGIKFDPHGNYVARWVPELAKLPVEWIHRPWEAPAEVLKAAGVVLGVDYPQPIVDHAVARQRALAAFETVKRSRQAGAASRA